MFLSWNKDIRLYQGTERSDNKVFNYYKGKQLRMQFGNSAQTNSRCLRGGLKHPLLQQNKHLPPGNEIKVSLHRTPDVFLVQGDAPLSVISITKIELHIPRVQINPTTEARLLRYNKILYPVTVYEEMAYTLTAGESNFERQALIMGRAPKHIIAVFLDTRGYLGEEDYSPFNYDHCKMDYIFLYQNGREIPFGGYKELEFGKPAKIIHGTALKPWNDYNKAVREKNPGKRISKPYSEWIAQGNTIWVFDMSPENKMKGFDANEATMTNSAPINIKMKFNAALGQTMTMLMYAAYDKLITLDRQTKRVHYNWV